MKEEKTENSINKEEIEKLKFNTNFKVNYDKGKDDDNIYLVISTTPDTQKVIKEFCVVTLPKVKYVIGSSNRERYRAKEWLLLDISSSTPYGNRYGKDYLFDKDFIDTGTMELTFTNIGDVISFISECKEKLNKCLTTIFTYKQLNVNLSYTIVPLNLDEKRK